MPSISEPCGYKFAKAGKHSLNKAGTLCRQCGARVAGTTDPSEIVAFEVAQAKFRDACEALDSMLGQGQRTPDTIIAWRSAYAALRGLEG